MFFGCIEFSPEGSQLVKTSTVPPKVYRALGVGPPQAFLSLFCSSLQFSKIAIFLTPKSFPGKIFSTKVLLETSIMKKTSSAAELSVQMSFLKPSKKFWNLVRIFLFITALLFCLELQFQNILRKRFKRNFKYYQLLYKLQFRKVDRFYDRGKGSPRDVIDIIFFVLLQKSSFQMCFSESFFLIPNQIFPKS